MLGWVDDSGRGGEAQAAGADVRFAESVLEAVGGSSKAFGGFIQDGEIAMSEACARPAQGGCFW